MPVGKKTTKGPVTRVPCPHCGHPNSFEEHWRQGKLEKKAIVGCDRCKRLSKIHDIRNIPIVLLQQYNRDLKTDDRVQTFEARARRCVHVSDNGAPCKTRPNSFMRCGMCEQIGESFQVDNCGAHRDSARRALGVHMKLEHRCIEASCSEVTVGYLIHGQFRACYCSKHQPIAQAALNDYRRHNG